MQSLEILATQKSSKAKEHVEGKQHTGFTRSSEAPAEMLKDTQKRSTKTPPSLPLPRLESTLNSYVSSIEGMTTPEELARTKGFVADFLKPNSRGQELQSRLQKRVDDPSIDGWLSDLYNDSNFLGRDTPLAPFSSYFYTHHQNKSITQQAEMAAVVTDSARKFKALYQAGDVQPQQINGQDTCMYLFQWLFNTHRKPGYKGDQMQKFGDEDYIIVLRFGRVFKVPLKKAQKDVAIDELQATFEAILNEVKGDISWAGVLTADGRRSWTKVRIPVHSRGTVILTTLY